jgi:hypothetical protein
MEKITEIKELYDFKKEKDDWQEYDGFQIITNKREFKILISNGQS